MERTLLHVSPHPDDEALGAPATLLLLRRGGWRVVNAVASLGRPEDHKRRLSEVEEAARRGGFDLALPSQPFAISRGNDLAAAEGLIAEWLRDVLVSEAVSLVVSPSPQDGHHGHEVVGRSVARAVADQASSVAWWSWGLWADLPLPTLYVPFDEDILLVARHLLDAYRGEIARNGYDRLLNARAVANAVLGAERVFGFGASASSSLPYAELLTELWPIGGAWQLGEPRVLDPNSPLGTPLHSGTDVTWWVSGASPQCLARR